MRFANKVAVVTGATSGIGEATALRLMSEGAKVIAIGRNIDKGKELESKGDCKFYAADFTKPEEIESVCDKIAEEIGWVNILVNSAGLSVGGTIEELTLAQWNEIFMVNVTATFLMSKYLLPLIRKQRGGRIVNIGSTAGTVGAWGLHAYSSTKGAVIQLSKSMACEYAKEGIMVNCVCPGGTKTPMMGDDQAFLDEFAQLFPIQRLADPSEIANVIAFAASDEASFMSGSVILVDGGFTCI